MKLVINSCYGGFSISWQAFTRLVELGHVGVVESRRASESTADDHRLREWVKRYYSPETPGISWEGDRHDPLLVQVVEELGNKANGRCSKLKVVEIPDGVQYEINDYDGMESVHETHREWS